MSQSVIFSISTPSRHPANQKGYDPDRHCYREDYVRPRFWVLDLHAFPRGLGESSDGKPIIPNEIASFKWTVKQVEGSFSSIIEKKRSPSMLKTALQIPEPGKYEITLQVNLTNGNPEINTRNYHLRDFLVVSIGDSFASGQGNPDIPAIPSPDEKAFCKATTLLLTTTKFFDDAKVFINEFMKQVKKEAKEAIEDYLPFIGKTVVAGLNEVEDFVGWVKGQIANIKGALIEVGKKAGALVVEGVEEFASWIGIGDGGESEETKPRPAGWQEPFAYRSYRSGHSLAARQIEMNSRADRVTFLSFARTGSEIHDGLLGPRMIDPDLFDADFFENVAIDGWTGNRGQIEEAKDTVLDRRIDALIISIGVNDLGFSTLTSDSILRESGEERKKRMDDTERKIKEELPSDLNLLRDAIESQLRPRKVFITEYPVGVYKEIETQGPCGVLGVKDRPVLGKGFLDLDTSDAKGLGELGRLLNETIRAKADEFGWVLIDGIERGFDGHGYCANRSYFVFAEESCLNQGDFEGMLHPNKLGHEVARDCIALALRRELLAPQEKWLEPVLNVMMR